MDFSLKFARPLPGYGHAYVSGVEETFSVRSPNDGVLSIIDESQGSYQSTPLHFVPQRHFLLRYIPNPQFTIKRPAQEKFIILKYSH